jgi:hypothetical protein
MNEQKDRGNHTMKNKRILFVATLAASVILGFSSYGENEGKAKLGDIRSDKYVVT